MNFSRHLLTNGVRVVFVPMLEAQTVLVQVLAGAGSHYENKKQNGLSHFLEHLLFKGTRKRPSSRIIAEEIDRIGGEINAFTDKEQTGYWARVEKRYGELALDVIADLYLNPLLKQEEIEKERGVILQEAAMYRDMPAAYVWDVFEKLLFGEQAAGRSIVGEDENIKNFQRKDFVQYLKKFYGSGNTVVAVAGNFQEEIFLKKIKELFGGKKISTREKKSAKMLPIKNFKSSSKVAFFSKKTDQAQFVLGAPAGNMFSPMRYAEKLLAVALGGGMSSRLFLNIREKRGLCYHISAGNEQNLTSGYFHISAGVNPAKLPLAVALIGKELQKIKTQKISSVELRKIKEYYKGKLLMSLESPTGAVTFFANQELYKGEIEEETVLLEKVEQVSAEEIRQAAERIFSVDQLRLAVITEQNKGQALAKILEKIK